LLAYGAVVCCSLSILLSYEGDVEQDFGLVFQASLPPSSSDSSNSSSSSTSREFDLIANGGDIPVTELNRDQYVRLFTDFRLYQSVQHQVDAFVKGFRSVCASKCLRLFSPSDLELLIGGTPVLDFHKLQQTCQVTHIIFT
jgi:hypothetical protein